MSFSGGKIIHDEINVTNSLINITQGSSVWVTCFRQPNSTSNWEKDEQNITTNTTASVHQLKSGIASALVIAALQPSQNGTYKCTSTSHAGVVEEYLTIGE